MAVKGLIRFRAGDFDVQDVTLLSVDEAECLSDDMRVIEGRWWWLRSVYDDNIYISLMDGKGSVYHEPVENSSFDFESTFGVRPVLKVGNLASLNLTKGDKFIVNYTPYTVISDDMVLCDNIITSMEFGSNSPRDNFFETSYVKQYIEDWADDEGFTFYAFQKSGNAYLLDLDQLDVRDVTVLSVEEVNKLRRCFRKLGRAGDDWWTLTPGSDKNNKVAIVDGEYGIVNSDGYNVDMFFGAGVRPALKISNLKSLNLNQGDRFKVNGVPYLVIFDDMAMTENIIDTCVFNQDCSKGVKYETSDLKKRVDDWSEEQGFAHIIFIDKVKEMYEQSGNSPLYKNLVNLISSDDFDINRLKEEFEAVNRIREKLSKVNKNKNFVREDAVEDIIFEDGVQKGLGE